MIKNHIWVYPFFGSHEMYLEHLSCEWYRFNYWSHDKWILLGVLKNWVNVLVFVHCVHVHGGSVNKLFPVNNVVVCLNRVFKLWITIEKGYCISHTYWWWSPKMLWPCRILFCVVVYSASCQLSLALKMNSSRYDCEENSECGEKTLILRNWYQNYMFTADYLYVLYY